MDEARGLSCDVLVVGGGPVALLAALCLSQRGVRCVVAERLDKRVALPRATRLSARSVEILLGLGITWEELEGRALPDDAAARSLICARIDEVLARIDLDEDGQREGLRRAVRHAVPTLSLDQTALEEILRAGLDATRGITLRPGMRFVGFEEDEQGITSHLASMSDGPDVSVRSSYLVGADGTDSPCRTAMGVRLNGMETGTRLACVRFRADLGSRLPVPAATIHLLDPVGYGSLHAADDAHRWIYRTPLPPGDEDVDPDELTSRIAAATGVHIRPERTAIWTTGAAVADRYRVGRALLVGDAAHRLPPLGSLNLDMGLADAHNLSWKLAAVINGHAHPRLLDTYSHERHAAAQQAAAAATVALRQQQELFEELGANRRQVEASRGRVHAPWLRWLSPTARDNMLALLTRSARKRQVELSTPTQPSRRLEQLLEQHRSAMEHVGLDLGVSYLHGALVADQSTDLPIDDVVRDHIPSTRPGHRLPHVWLDFQDGTSSHDLLDYARFTLMVAGDPLPWQEALEADLTLPQN